MMRHTRYAIVPAFTLIALVFASVLASAAPSTGTATHKYLGSDRNSYTVNVQEIATGSTQKSQFSNTCAMINYNGYWYVSYPIRPGRQTSPLAVDENGDGVLDRIVQKGKTFTLQTPPLKTIFGPDPYGTMNRSEMPYCLNQSIVVNS